MKTTIISVNPPTLGIETFEHVSSHASNIYKVKEVGRLSSDLNGTIDKLTQFSLWGMISVSVHKHIIHSSNHNEEVRSCH